MALLQTHITGDKEEGTMVAGMKASMIAHGIRNPLNAMKGVLEYLRIKYSEDPALTQFAQIMGKEISAFDVFISQFLSASLVREKDSTLNVNSLLKKIQIVTSFQAAVNNIQTGFIYGDIPEVRANAFHLGHAILNIINNAIEAMPSGGKLQVKTQLKGNARSGHPWVMVEVSDNGPGMAVGKFSPAPPAPGKSKGFGLFITHEILRSCGGRVAVKNRKSQGTVITLSLPAKETKTPCKQ